MSGYWWHTYYPRSVTNPEGQRLHISKLETLLEEYDRENEYLNKQVITLLNRNKQLERKSFDERIINHYGKRIATEKKERMDRKMTYARNKNFNTKYKYTQMPPQEEQEPKKLQKIVEKRKQVKKQQKQVKFTKDPYIQEDSMVRHKPIKDQKQQRRKQILIIQNQSENQYPSQRKDLSEALSPIKKGIQLIGKSQSKQKLSNREKSEERLSVSKLSRKSSKRSGIKIYSNEVKEEHKQAIKEQPVEQPVPEKKQTQSVPDLKLHVNQNRMPQIIFTPSKQNATTKYEQQVIYPQNSVYIPMVTNSASQIQQHYFSQTNPIQRNNSLKSYERHPSVHKIQPSSKIRHESINIRRVNKQSQRSSSMKGKKKFLSLVSSTFQHMKQGQQKNTKQVQ